MNIYFTTQFAQQYCCAELTRDFDFCAFSWVRRGANSIVYPFAKFTFQMGPMSVVISFSSLQFLRR